MNDKKSNSSVARFIAAWCVVGLLMASLIGCNMPDKKAYASEAYASFSQYIADHNPQVLDVRTAEEYAKGHIQNAINIDVKLPEFSKRADSLLEKKRPVAVYCRSGKRSKIAADLLTDMGYEVVELDGGIMSWKGKLEYGVN